MTYNNVNSLRLMKTPLTAPAQNPRFTPKFGPKTKYEIVRKDQSKFESVMDRAGIWLSGICMVHCVLTPIVLVSLPMFTFAKSEAVHIALAGVLPIVTFAAFIPGVRRHRDWMVLVLGLVGLLFIIYAATDPMHILNQWTEGAVTSIGSLTLIAGHMRNRKNVHCADPTHRH